MTAAGTLKRILGGAGWVLLIVVVIAVIVVAAMAATVGMWP